MMFSVTLVCFLLIMTASILSLPISGTHAVIMALLGSGWIGTTFQDLNWKKFSEILLNWVLSPSIAAIIAYLIFLAVMKYSIDYK